MNKKRIEDDVSDDVIARFFTKWPRDHIAHQDKVSSYNQI